MEKHKAIPHGYMTVGEVAKKMDVTVRTLQHYDREGLLSPSAISEGGRRLYTDKDIVKLHQIALHIFKQRIRIPIPDRNSCIIVIRRIRVPDKCHMF